MAPRVHPARTEGRPRFAAGRRKDTMIHDYPHSEINEGAEHMLKRRGLHAELARSLAKRPVAGVAACFVLGLAVGGAVTFASLKAAEAARKRRPLDAPSRKWTAKMLKFPTVRDWEATDE